VVDHRSVRELTLEPVAEKVRFDEPIAGVPEGHLEIPALGPRRIERVERVDPHDPVPPLEQAFHELAADETRGAGHYRVGHLRLHLGSAT
jgi:hypothetical protein